MKDFVATFFICLVACIIFTIFFAGLVFSNVWYIIIFAAFLLAILTTLFISQESRIEELEKKMEQKRQSKEIV